MHRRFVVALVTLIVALLGSTAAAQAAAVTNANDSGPGSLRQAILDAAPGETIALPAGDYRVSSESLFIEKSLTLAGAGPATTVVRSTGPFRVFAVAPPAPGTQNVTLSGITVRDGREFEESAIGAGIAAFETNLTLRNTVVTGNIASSSGEGFEGKGGSAFGAGVLIFKGTVAIVESRIEGNIAEANGEPGAPGGIAQGAGLLVLAGSYTIEKSALSGNVAKASGGQGASDVKQDGGSAAGAGIGTVSPDSPSAIVATTISGNLAEAPAGPGGGSVGLVAGAGFFSSSKTAPVTVTDSTIAQNISRNGQVPGPSPSFGGGVVALTEPGGKMTFTGVTIAANKLETASPGSLAGNVVFGGVAGSIGIRNSIVANGVGPVGAENCGQIPAGTSPLVSEGFNLDSLDQCGFKAAGDKVNTDPLLGPLAANGGLTQTMAPAPTSAAIDQGKSFGLAADQRGVLRPIDLPSIPNSTAAGADGTDIGAYELQPSNALTLGKLKKNKKKGTATVAVTLPQPAAGVLTLTGKGLKPQKVTIGATSKALKLTIAGKSKAIKKGLAKKGKRKVKFEVSYTPTGNTATKLTRKATLVKKTKKKSVKH